MPPTAAPPTLVRPSAAAPPDWPRTLATSASLRDAARRAERTPKPTSYRSDEQERRHDRLLDVAETELADKGLLEASLQEIGAALGFPPYAVRAQFGNKELVVRAVLDRHLDRLIDRLRVYQDGAEALAPEDRLIQAVAVLCDLLFAYQAGQRVFVAAWSGAAPALARALRLRQRHLVHYFAGLIADAVPEAAGRTELIAPAALSLLGMASWHVLWFREAGALRRADYAQLVSHMVLDGLRAAAAAGLGGWDASAAVPASLPADGGAIDLLG